MNFRSDNEVGAHPGIVEAVARAFASGSTPSYGADEWTQKVERRLRELFDKPDLLAFPVATGTAANVLSLAWDQNVALRAMSPTAATLEDIAGKWLRDILRLPDTASFAFVTGATTASFTCLAAARRALLLRWWRGAPRSAALG